MSNDEFGEMFGLNKGVVLSYRHGKSKPKLETLIKLSEKYRYTLDQLCNIDISEMEKGKKQSIYSNNDNYINNNINENSNNGNTIKINDTEELNKLRYENNHLLQENEKLNKRVTELETKIDTLIDKLIGNK
jgi:transcriptional regulator with XRE-family HTH domain